MSEPSPTRYLNLFLNYTKDHATLDILRPGHHHSFSIHRHRGMIRIMFRNRLTNK